MRKLVFILIIFALAACGKKDVPRPKSDLNIPVPREYSIEIKDDGVHIYNYSGEYELYLERAESEVGDISSPKYDTIAFIPVSEEYIDTDSNPGKRYIYRLSTYARNYNAYSKSVTEKVSYDGKIEIEEVKWSISGNDLCVDVSYEENVAGYDIMINGIVQDKALRCHKMPSVPEIILTVIPYSESRTKGNIYSHTIVRDLSQALLPPQNVKILQNGRRVTLSWDKMPKVNRYNIVIKEEASRVERNTDITVFSYNINECASFELRSVRGRAFSDPVVITACR